MEVIVQTDYNLSLETTSNNMTKYLNKIHNQSIKPTDLFNKIKAILIVENRVLKVISPEKNQEYIDLNNFFNLFYSASIYEIIILSNKFKSNVKVSTHNLKTELETSLETIKELRDAYIKLKRHTNSA